MMSLSLDEVINRIREHSQRVLGRASLIGFSGIDGSGKGYLAARLEPMLTELGLRIACISIDDSLEHPDGRFNPHNPAEHFYLNGLRLEEKFARLIRPLRDRRSISLTTTIFDSSNSGVGYRRTYEFHNVDVIILEGIFIFKAAYRQLFDLRFWVDCTFQTAMERVLSRNQEKLPPSEILRDYETIYFPAERIHFERDDPRSVAHGIIINDHRLNAAHRTYPMEAPLAAG